MAQDILGRNDEGFGGAYKADDARLTIDEISDLLVTNINASYTQQVNRVFDMTDNRTYYIRGQAQGQGTIASLIGPKGAGDIAYATLSDPCNKSTLTFNFAGAGCESASGVNATRVLKHVVLMGISDSISANDMVLNEQLSFQFARMSN